MKFYELLTNFLQTIILLIQCSIGVYVFSKSSLFIALFDALYLFMSRSPILSIFLELFSIQMFLIFITAFLFILGLKIIVFNKNKGRGLMIFLFLFYLSPILSNSSFDWLKLFNDISFNYPNLKQYFITPSLYVNNELSYLETLFFSFIFIISFVLLRNIWYNYNEKEDYRMKGANELDIKEVFIQSQRFSTSIIGISILMVGILSALSFDLTDLLLQYLLYPWGLIVIGVISTTVISVSVYFYLYNNS